MRVTDAQHVRNGSVPDLSRTSRGAEQLVKLIEVEQLNNRTTFKLVGQDVAQRSYHPNRGCVANRE